MAVRVREQVRARVRQPVPRLELASLKESAILELGLEVRDWVDGDDPYALVAAALPGRDDRSRERHRGPVSDAGTGVDG